MIGCYKISNSELKNPLSVGLSNTAKTFNFLTLFVALIGTIDAGVTSGGFKGSGSPLLKPEKYKKNFYHIKFIAIAGSRSISCPDLLVKYSMRLEMNNEHLQNHLFFVNADELG